MNPQIEHIVSLALRHMEEVKREFGVSEELWQRWQAWLGDDSYWPDYSELTHGDHHPGHTLIDPNERLPVFSIGRKQGLATPR